jgi:hypothetical protein
MKRLADLKQSTVELSLSEDEKMEADPLLQELLEIRDEMTRRLRDRKVPARLLKQAYAAGDEQAVLDLMGYSRDEAARLRTRLAATREALLAKHPRLADATPARPKTAGDVARFLDRYEKLTESYAPEVYSKKKPTCKWLQYSAALGLCAVSGPVIYWPCAYLAMCSLCSGGYVDDICV